MKVAFLIGSAEMSGGTYVIYQHALYAQRKGFDVYLIPLYPMNPTSLDWHPDAQTLQFVNFEEAAQIFFDVAICTWWRTVFELPRVPAAQQLYFVQSIESRFYSEREGTLRALVDSTYSLPLPVLTEATWIKNYLQEKYGRRVELAHNGIRKEIYKEQGAAFAPRESGKLRVLVEGPVDVEFKNVREAIGIAAESNAHEVWLLTPSNITSYPGADRVFSKLPIHHTPYVYRSCDVLVKLSYVEGMFGPPLEMFHCGGTAITYDVSGHDEYLRNQINSLVVPSGESHKVLESLNLLCRQEEVLHGLQNGALKTAEEWPGWNEASERFWGAAVMLRDEANVSPAAVNAASRAHFHLYELAEQYRLQASNGTPIGHLKKAARDAAPELYERMAAGRRWASRLVGRRDGTVLD